MPLELREFTSGGLVVAEASRVWGPPGMAPHRAPRSGRPFWRGFGRAVLPVLIALAFFFGTPTSHLGQSETEPLKVVFGLLFSFARVAGLGVQPLEP